MCTSLLCKELTSPRSTSRRSLPLPSPKSIFARPIYTFLSVKSTLPSCSACKAMESFSKVSLRLCSPASENVKPEAKLLLSVSIVTKVESDIFLANGSYSSKLNKRDSTAPSARCIVLSRPLRNSTLDR